LRNVAWKPLHIYALLLIGGLFIRLLYAYHFSDHLFEGDAAYYLHDAKNLLRGENYLPYWPPALPYLVAVTMKAFGHAEAAFIGMMLLIYVCFSYMLFDLTKKLLNERLAYLAMCIFAIYPAFIHHSVAPLSQLPAALFLLGTFWSYWHYQSMRKNYLLLLMGGFLALLILTRPSAIFLGFILSAIFLGSPLLGRHIFPRVKKLLLVGILPIILIGSWQIKAWKMTGHLLWINEANSKNFFIGNNAYTPLYKSWWLGSQDERNNPHFQGYYELRASIEALPTDTQNRAWSKEAWNHILSRPDLFLIRALSKVRTFFAFDTYVAGSWWTVNQGVAIALLLIDASCYIFLGLTAIWGIFSSAIAERHKMIWFSDNLGEPSRLSNSRRIIPRGISVIFAREPMILGLFILAYAFPYFIAFSHPNYHLPIMPLVAVFSGYFLYGRSRAQLLIFLKQLNWKCWLASAIFILIQIEWIVVRFVQIY